MKLCTMCNDPIDQIDKERLRGLRKAAMQFPGSKKEEMRKIQILVFKFSNQKVCEYCFMEELTRLTTIMRIKAMQQNNV